MERFLPLLSTVIACWAALPGDRGTARAALLPVNSLSPQQKKHQHQQSPPAVLRFYSPRNGSMVDGPDVHLHYNLLGGAGDGDHAGQLTNTEISLLSPTTTMCFKLHGFSDKQSPICAPLSSTTVTIKDALPAKWHTVSGNIVDSFTSEVFDGSEDRVTVFVSLENYGLLDMCGQSACLDTTELRSAYFDHVFRHPKWDGNTADLRGPVISSTSSIRSALAETISSYNIRTMLDAPCGDVTWMALVAGIEGVQYTGADISEHAVESNRLKFDVGGHGLTEGFDPEVDEEIISLMEHGQGLQDPVFLVADMVEGVPASRDGRPFDLVFVRDLMLHLPARHNLRVLQHIQASGARFLMASTFVQADENSASETFIPPVGHSINLSLPPYCLPKPMALVEDDFTGRSDLRMGLWELHPDQPLVLSGDCSPISVTE